MNKKLENDGEVVSMTLANRTKQNAKNIWKGLQLSELW